ncbi:MAG: DUF4303 domain-containing protein [Lachnospiraceae bacterium]|nr:DUF4303 domain-containing protein [Lachnospiraceae bacterium]
MEYDEKLVQMIREAAGKAFGKLFAEHDETFYYCSLITIGECECPYISAWSLESLEREAAKGADPEEDKRLLKWSYADSPYCAYGYEEFFQELRAEYSLRTKRLDDDDDEAYDTEMDIRMNSMEKAMQELDAQGLFGTGEKRSRMVINAEYMPPDHSNTERALRLNPEEALTEWLDEAAE